MERSDVWTDGYNEAHYSLSYSHLRDGAHYPINASVSSQSQSLVLWPRQWMGLGCPGSHVPSGFQWARKLFMPRQGVSLQGVGSLLREWPLLLAGFQGTRARATASLLPRFYDVEFPWQQALVCLLSRGDGWHRRLLSPLGWGLHIITITCWETL